MLVADFHLKTVNSFQPGTNFKTARSHIRTGSYFGRNFKFEGRKMTKNPRIVDRGSALCVCVCVCERERFDARSP